MIARNIARGAAGGEGPGAGRSSLRALSHRDFALFFGGNLLSNCGTWFQNIALALLVYRLTRSSLWVGVANFAQFAGVLVLAPWAGPAADRFDRRRLILATQLAAMALSGALAALVGIGRGSLPTVLALALVLGLTTAFSTPALQAILPALVPREDLGGAIAMNSVTFNLARAIGPVAGALVVARLGIPWAIGVNALSYGVFAGILLAIRPARQPARSGERPRFRDSLRMVRRERHLAVLLAVVAAVSFALDPVSTLTPAFATQLFHRSDTFAGVLIGAFGTGAVLASVLPAGPSRHAQRILATMLMIFGGSMIGFALSPSLAVGMGVLAIAGFGYLSGQTRATTQLQLQIEDSERGRVMALWSVAFLGSRPIASLVDGGLGALIGPRAATIVLALPALAAAWLLIAGREVTSGPRDGSGSV